MACWAFTVLVLLPAPIWRHYFALTSARLGYSLGSCWFAHIPLVLHPDSFIWLCSVLFSPWADSSTKTRGICSLDSGSFCVSVCSLSLWAIPLLLCSEIHFPTLPTLLCVIEVWSLKTTSLDSLKLNKWYQQQTGDWEEGTDKPRSALVRSSSEGSDFSRIQEFTLHWPLVSIISTSFNSPDQGMLPALCCHWSLGCFTALWLAFQLFQYFYSYFAVWNFFHQTTVWELCFPDWFQISTLFPHTSSCRTFQLNSNLTRIIIVQK